MDENESDSRGPKEVAYDTHFHPVMAQLIGLAKEHGITMFAHFVLDEDHPDGPLSCTTCIPQDEDDELCRGFWRVARPSGDVYAFAIGTVGGEV
jgi:hypothetical protein